MCLGDVYVVHLISPLSIEKAEREQYQKERNDKNSENTQMLSDYLLFITSLSSRLRQISFCHKFTYYLYMHLPRERETESRPRSSSSHLLILACNGNRRPQPMRLAFMTTTAAAANHLLDLTVSQKLLTVRQQENPHLQNTLSRRQRLFHNQIRLQRICCPTLLPCQASG